MTEVRFIMLAPEYVDFAPDAFESCVGKTVLLRGGDEITEGTIRDVRTRGFGHAVTFTVELPDKLIEENIR